MSVRLWPDRLRSPVELARDLLASGPTHRRRLADVDVRISVAGVRGKSTATRWLHDVFYDRGYDTYAKITGVEPLSVYNDTVHEIERGPTARLYENERELWRFGNVDAAIVENQGLREYTMRLVNEQFVRPEVVFLTNAREDHLDTLGGDRLDIARALARSIPSGVRVVNGEQDPTIRRYLEAELDRRDATVTHLDIPPEHRTLPGAEIVYGLNPILRAVDEQPLNEATIESYLRQMDVYWTHLQNGRVFNAAAANDAQSTELIRRRLLRRGDEPIQPLLYVRDDRRGRTATFFRYLESLAERGAIEQARVVGEGAELIARRASFPVVVHDEDREDPGRVLEAAVSDGWPVMLMGNTVSEFMRGMADAVDRRALTPAESGFEWLSPRSDEEGGWRSLVDEAPGIEWAHPTWDTSGFEPATLRTSAADFEWFSPDEPADFEWATPTGDDRAFEWAKPAELDEALAWATPTGDDRAFEWARPSDADDSDEWFSSAAAKGGFEWLSPVVDETRYAWASPAVDDRAFEWPRPDGAERDSEWFTADAPSPDDATANWSTLGEATREPADTGLLAGPGGFEWVSFVAEAETPTRDVDETGFAWPETVDEDGDEFAWATPTDDDRALAWARSPDERDAG
jgi:hypothetical protein